MPRGKCGSLICRRARLLSLTLVREIVALRRPLFSLILTRRVRSNTTRVYFLWA